MKWWDGGKSLIKGLTIHYCCWKAGARSRLRDLLVRLIDHLKAKVDLGSSSCLGPYHSALAELAPLDSHVAKGAQVRSRVKWVEEGESSSLYFFRLERKRGSDRWISALRDEDDSIVSSPHDLCTSLSSFFSGLFSASPVDPCIQSDLLGNLSSSLPDDQSSLCEGHLSVEEVLVALRGMARRKAPGLDGLPMEFYLKFWSVLGSDLVAVLNSSFDSGCLSLSQRRGVISLSFKKGDRLHPRNWWPITLLNVDYKLTSRAIAGRLLKVIHLLVAEDQTCGVPGRFIGENVALLQDVVTFASSCGAPVAILSLDQEKAFIFWWQRIRLAGSLAVLSGRMWPFYGTWSLLRLLRGPQWPFSLSIKRRPSTVSTGVSCDPPLWQWALALLLSPGWICFTIGCNPV